MQPVKISKEFVRYFKELLAKEAITMTQKTASKLAPGSLRAYQRNSDALNWAIRDADNHMVAEHIPKQLALLFVKAPEMYELLSRIVDEMERFDSDSYGDVLNLAQITTEARRIKAEIDGEG